MNGSLRSLKEELEWFRRQSHEYKIFIAGNHDFACEHFMREGREDLLHELAYPAIYLRDSPITIDGRVFYGSPWQPWFFNWAFNLQRGADIRSKWDLIPLCDVLVTHGPPMFVLDRVGKDHAGCEDLANRVLRVAPKVHVFGHIHEGYGHERKGMTDYYNASVVDARYRLVNQPWEVEL